MAGPRGREEVAVCQQGSHWWPQQLWGGVWRTSGSKALGTVDITGAAIPESALARQGRVKGWGAQ